MDIYFVVLLLLLIVGGIAYLIWSFWHTPKKEIGDNVKNIIEQHGLQHFTHSSVVDSILKEGIKPCASRRMKKSETNLVWLYLNTDFEKHRKSILKGDRKKNDTVIIVKNVSAEQLSNLRIRNDGAITYNGILKTDLMIPVEIKKYSSSVFNQSK